jgi:hypothetical protein
MSPNPDIQGELTARDIASLVKLSRATGQHVISIVSRAPGSADIATGATLDPNSRHGNYLTAQTIAGEWVLLGRATWRVFE